MNAHRMNQKKLAQPSTDQKDAQKVEFLFFVLRLKWNINPEFYDTLRWQMQKVIVLTPDSSDF